MSNSDEQGWGTWEDAEGWRRVSFKERSLVARLAWLEDVWRLRSAGRMATEATINAQLPGADND